MEKKELRKVYKKKRVELTTKETEIKQDLLLIQFQMLELPFLQAIHTYIAASELNEPDPENIVRWLQFGNPGLITAAPVADFKSGEMKHVCFDENTEFVLNKFNVAEPLGTEELPAEFFDLVIVPLLAFDENGFRVGYGKGFYDRFLSACKPDVLKIGLSFFPAVDQIDDTNTFDQRLDYCITPERIYEF